MSEKILAPMVNARIEKTGDEYFVVLRIGSLPNIESAVKVSEYIRGLFNVASSFVIDDMIKNIGKRKPADG